jgi:microcystin-dependent protein
MSNPFIAQINLFAGAITPKYWLNCDGQNISTGAPYIALFNLLGKAYGGNGIENFSMPNIPDADKVRYMINSFEIDPKSEPPSGTVGEICLFYKNNIPENWIACDGTQLKVNDYLELHQLIGGKFGHGNDSFALPSLPPPIDGFAYAICHNGAIPWGQDGLKNITFVGTIGAIQLFPTPEGFQSDTWALCNGQSLSMGSNELLYSQIGPKWGSSGGNFNVPTIEGPAMGINYIICTSGIFPSE